MNNRDRQPGVILMTSRVKQAEARTAQAIAARAVGTIPVIDVSVQKNAAEKLTGRQREILLLIAQGENPKQIGDLLKISPKTVEYHRAKLMNGLNVHDIPGLVRFALRVGMLAPGS